MSDSAQTAAAPAAPAPGSPEHDASMAALFDSRQAPVPGEKPAAELAPQRPENVPEKFWDAKAGAVNTEALLKSYVELEKGKTATPAVDPTKPGLGIEKPAEGTPAADKAVEAAAGALSASEVEGFSKEFSEAGGKLSEESFKALEAKGLPRTYVESYIAGQVALAQAAQMEGFAAAGGQEAYGRMAAWAGTALSPADLTAYNNAVESSDPAVRKMAVTSLRAQFEAANGQSQRGMLQGQGAPAAVQGYQSNAEMVRDMSDKRYKSDPAFRKMVTDKISSGSVFGTVQETAGT